MENLKNKYEAIREALVALEKFDDALEKVVDLCEKEEHKNIAHQDNYEELAEFKNDLHNYLSLVVSEDAKSA